MRIVVTGVAGYIGRSLVERLHAQGHHVIGLDRSAWQGPKLERFVRCDLLEPSSYADLLAGADCICHLAAAKGDWGISEAEYFRDNLQATRALLEAAERANVHRWVFYSTVSVLGPSDVPLDESAARRPANPYGASKAGCEELYEQYLTRNPRASVVTIRPSVVFGPDNPWNTNIFRLIESIYHKRFVMIGAGAAVKTTSYIENLLDAHMLLMERQLAAVRAGIEIYHYVDEPAESTAKLVQRIYRHLNKRAPRLRLPLALASPLALAGDAAARVLKIDLPITSARIRKFCTGTNFASDAIRRAGYAQRVDNDEAMRRTVDWYLHSYLQRRSA